MTPLKEAARGRWRGVLQSLGVSSKALTGKNGPCPICLAGKDRFRFDDKEGRGTFICSHCGAGDGIEFVKLLRNVDFKSAAELIEPLLGASPVVASKPATSEAEQRRWRNDAWLGAAPVRVSDPAGRYLRARVGLEQYPRCLRCHPSLRHPDSPNKLPAMLAIVSGPDGKPANLHRTYLTADGEKAVVDPVRLMMPGEIPDGSAIRLALAAATMGVAEGIETAFAASALFDMPVWSTVSASTLAKFRAPAGVEKLVVFADNDLGFAGQAAAYACARANAPRNVKVEVRMPDRIGSDWNDVFLQTQLVST